MSDDRGCFLVVRAGVRPVFGEQQTYEGSTIPVRFLRAHGFQLYSTCRWETAFWGPHPRSRPDNVQAPPPPPGCCGGRNSFPLPIIGCRGVAVGAISCCCGYCSSSMTRIWHLCLGETEQRLYMLSGMATAPRNLSNAKVIRGPWKCSQWLTGYASCENKTLDRAYRPRWFIRYSCSVPY